MTDYSEAELTAIETMFPDTKTYLCDFHREQAWIRWCRDRRHGLTEAETDSLLDMLRTCAWTPPANEPDPAQHYKEAVSQLKNSCGQVILLSDSSFSSTWLSIPEVHV